MTKVEIGTSRDDGNNTTAEVEPAVDLSNQDNNLRRSRFVNGAFVVLGAAMGAIGTRTYDYYEARSKDPLHRLLRVEEDIIIPNQVKALVRDLKSVDPKDPAYAEFLNLMWDARQRVIPVISEIEAWGDNQRYQLSDKPSWRDSSQAMIEVCYQLEEACRELKGPASGNGYVWLSGVSEFSVYSVNAVADGCDQLLVPRDQYDVRRPHEFSTQTYARRLAAVVDQVLKQVPPPVVAVAQVGNK